MTGTPVPAWRPTGLVWTEAGAALEWLSPVGDVRASAVEPGVRLSLRVGPDRRCIGLWWDGRRVPCTARAPMDAGAKSGQCDSCAAIARTRSVATDTVLDDPREFCVYLAHHGSVVKAGITATERGQARLLEQGALSSMVLPRNGFDPRGRARRGRRTSCGPGLAARSDPHRYRPGGSHPGVRVARRRDRR